MRLDFPPVCGTYIHFIVMNGFTFPCCGDEIDKQFYLYDNLLASNPFRITIHFPEQTTGVVIKYGLSLVSVGEDWRRRSSSSYTLLVWGSEQSLRSLQAERNGSHMLS